MPQIMCPNCGMTINLENRREIDCDLIESAAEKSPRTFTELLHITRLSRKTLSLRLKEMCKNGVLVRNGRMYSLNGGSEYMSDNGKSTEKLFKVFRDKRIRIGFMLLTLLAFSSASGYVLATFLAPTKPEPEIIGSFTMALDIGAVADLYGWQVVIDFDSSKLKVMEVTSGNFVGTRVIDENTTDFTEGMFVKEIDNSKRILLLAGSLVGDVSGKDGPGRLAAIVFGYYVTEYQMPEIVSEKAPFETYLVNSQLHGISIEETTLTLSIVEN